RPYTSGVNCSPVMSVDSSAPNSAHRPSPSGEPLRRALVLSGGGMFGAWQAGAWATLATRTHFDLVVGASVGALNGYSIACGISPLELRRIWLDPSFAR